MIDPNHKLLVHMFKQRTEKAYLRQERQVSFITQFTTNLVYLSGSKNLVADSLSRVVSVRLPTEFCLIDLAQAQSADEELKKLILDPNCSLNFKKIFLGPDHAPLYCDLTGEVLRPCILPSLRRRVFYLFHNPAHPGARVTHWLSGNATFGLACAAMFRLGARVAYLASSLRRCAITSSFPIT